MSRNTAFNAPSAKALTYSVVICTLERPDDLKKCVGSWLRQEPLPQDIVVVHGRPEGELREDLERSLSGTGVELNYISTDPCLVRQRNIGIERAKGDVVFFADDDAVYSDGYAQAILNVYQDDREGLTGGVQGAIDDFDLGPAERCGFSRVFMLPRFGKGRLQLSAWPAFIRPAKELSQVEVFSGPAMSYRKEVLREFRFNEAFKQYWMGDDFEMAYRVSRKYRLFHQPQARLNHYLSAASREGERRKCKMAVVNHYYLSRAIFGYGLKPRLAWFWSEVGLWLVALLCLFSGRGVTRLMGMFDGYTELLSIRRKR